MTTFKEGPAPVAPVAPVHFPIVSGEDIPVLVKPNTKGVVLFVPPASHLVEQYLGKGFRPATQADITAYNAEKIAAEKANAEKKPKKS